MIPEGRTRRADSAEAFARKFGAAGTVILWALLALLFAVSPFFQKKKRYETVRITLVSAEAAERPARSASPAPAAAPQKAAPQETAAALPPPAAKSGASARQNAGAPSADPPAASKSPPPAPQKTAPKAAPQKTAPKAAPQKTAPKAAPPAKKESITYKKSVDELMAEQAAAAAAKSAAPDESAFDRMFDETPEPAAPQPAPARNGAERISGAAALSGTAATATERGAAETGFSETARTASSRPSGATAGALGKIRDTVYQYQAGNGVVSESSVAAVGTADGVQVAMEDGSARALLAPARPVIELSPESAALIDSTRSVSVRFTVLADGNVLLSGISVSPSSALPVQVQAEIRAQIAKWRFAPAAVDGRAGFIYSIIKE